jgi:hypothetical protein
MSNSLSQTNKLTKDSFSKDFFKNTINDFKDKDRYINFLDDTDLENKIDFKGVQVIRDKNSGAIYEVSSHGNFAKDSDKIIKPNFNLAWNPLGRWRPYFMNLDEKYIAFGWHNSKSAQIYNEVIRGIDVEKLSPKDKVYEHFLKIHIEKKRKHPNNRDNKDKKKSLRASISIKNLPPLIKSYPNIYKKIIYFDDLIIDRFLINEEDPFLTPVFFKEVLINYFKTTTDKYYCYEFA